MTYASIKKFFVIASILLGVFSLCTISHVHAATGDYITLAPLPGTTDCNSSELNGAQYNCTTNFQTYLPAAFNLSIAIAAALAFIMISYGGFELMTTDSINGKMDGRKKVTDAVYGLILVLGAYAILYTINPQILNFNLNIGTPKYSELPSGASSDTVATPISGADLTNDAVTRSMLAAASVTVQSDACVGTNTHNCVNVNNLQPDTITGVEALEKAGNMVPKCAVISGGSEGGHSVGSEHSKGTALDLVDQSGVDCLSPVIKQYPITKTTSDGCPTYTDKATGNSYLFEPKGKLCGGTVQSSGDHYHATFP